MTSTPSFIQAFANPTHVITPSLKEPTIGTVRTSRPAVRYFTERDRDTFLVVQEFLEAGEPSPSNKDVGAALGISRAAGSERVRRLIEMGVLSAEYGVSQETGHRNQRTLTIRLNPLEKGAE